MSDVSEQDPLSAARRIVDDGLAAIAAAASLDALRAVDTDLLGKASELSRLKASMRDVAPEDRKKLGQALNEARAAIEDALTARRSEFESAARRDQLASEQLDLSEAIVDRRVGHHHLITQTREM